MKTYKECEFPINILGTPYRLIICPDDRDHRFKDLNCGGFCDYSVKKLMVSNYTGESEKNDAVEDVRYIIQKAILHEMVHAYLYESGLGEDWEHKAFGHEETTVDWIARQLIKMNITSNYIFEKLPEYETEV